MTIKPLTVTVIVIGSIVLFFLVQLLIIRFNGKPVAAPDIPRQTRTSGEGQAIRYAVMGDSTAISQGSEYEDGFAIATTNRLAKTHTVAMINTGVSGATTPEVSRDQLKTVLQFQPDIVLLAAGANDATHFIRSRTTEEALQTIVDELKSTNPDIHIIVTGSPAMDSVPRFPLGSKWLMRLRTEQVNRVFDRLVDKNNLTFAPIADQTRDAFLADPSLTAADNFHPNARGYALWVPVINRSIDEALSQ